MNEGGVFGHAAHCIEGIQTAGVYIGSVFYAIAAYLMWGFFPAFFPLLLPASPTEILAHRIIWTAAWVVGFLLVAGTWRELKSLSAKTWGWLVLAGLLISVNWGTYVIAVNSQHVADAALGYFINPLVSVALGIIFLRESLRPLQAIAVAVAVCAVIYLTLFTGQAPYISLALAASFGFYGLIKKRINVSSAGSVAAETLVMLPLALAYVTYLQSTGAGTFASEGLGHTALLISSGIVTALPLLCFAQGAKALSMSTIGMLQYMTPIMQMLWALLVTHEHFSTHRWIGFAIIGVAVLLYVTDLVRNSAGRSRTRV